MKKFLALVLALVMTLGLAAVSSNAAYSDAADVDLAEAVDVMSAVGVFQGSDGKFDPKANLTREQAAKLIAYLDLGEKAAEALPAVKVFDDVEATRWSAKYIAYCQDAGYIAGVGNNKFNPTGELTGYAFGKMVLCVLGYDADIEGFTGASWSINVAKLMESNDINDGVDGSASATLTREQAAQYCLNALEATMVEYDTKGTNIEINGAKIATGASKAEEVVTAANYDGSIKNDGKLQLGEKLYKGDLKFAERDDDFGAPASKWTYKTSDVGTYADAPDATYTDKVTKGTIYTLLGKDVVDDLAAGNAKLNYFTNGVDADAVAAGEAANADHTHPDYQAAYAAHNDRATNAVKNSTAAAFGTGNGTVTEVYIDDDGVTVAGEKYAKVTVVVKYTYLLQATADYNAKTEKLSVKKLTGANVTSLSADDFALTEYKKDDYILYTYAAGEVQTIEKAEVVSGKVSTYTKGDSVTLDGTKYKYNKAAYDIVGEHSKNVEFTINETAKVVLDKAGYIVYIDEVKASNDDVVFVTGVTLNGFDVQAKIVNVDGTKKTVTVDTDDSDALFKTANNAVLNKFWAYEVDGDKYELTAYAKQDAINVAGATPDNPENIATYADNALLLNKVTTVANKTANSKTVYIVADEDDDITVYTGVKNAPDFTGYVKTAAATFNSDNEVVYVFAKVLNDNAIDDSSNTEDQMIYILKIGDKTITDSNKKTYVEVKALVDGEETTLKVKQDEIYDATTNPTGEVKLNELYKKLKTNSDGFVTGATTVAGDADYVKDDVTAQANAFGYSDGVFTAKAGTPYSKFIKTDKVFVIVAKNGGALLDDAAADYEWTATSFDGLKSFVEGYTVTGNFVVALNSDKEITCAYVTITNSVETPPAA